MRLIVLTSALLAVCGATAAGQSFTDLDRNVLVMFRSGYLTEEPHMEHGVLQLVNGPSKTALEPIRWVTSLRPLYRKGICGFSIEGPWFITITTERTTEQLVAEIAARPEVLRCTAANADDPNEPPLLGEATKSWFPPEAGQAYGLFCKFEDYFDFPRPSEEPFPTLDSLAVDACGWYREVFEGQYPNPYYPRDIDLPQAWAITRGSPDIVVAIIDTGVDWLHPDLGGTGVPDSSAFDELLTSYTNGIIYTNVREGIGDANHDGATGVLGQDDDGDGMTDEDPTGLVYGNVKETALDVYTQGGVYFGTVSSLGDSSITDSQASFVPGGLVGRWVRGNYLQYYALYDSIVWNDATTIKTAGLGERMASVMRFGGWPIATAPGRGYMISDLEDSDGDGVVDDWWDYDPSDDEENGFPDDLKGWDFSSVSVNPDGLPFTASLIGDNDARPDTPAGNGGHGTWLSGVLAALANADGQGIVGVAPAIKVVPIRVYPTGDTDATLAAALQYARCLRDGEGNRLVDIVVMATGRSVGTGHPEWDCGTFLEPDGQSGVYADPFAEQLRLAFADGIVVVNGAGNQNGESPDPYFSACFQEAIAVGGVDALHRPWLDMEGDGTTYGSWVDVTARALNLIVTSQCQEPEHTCHCGLGQIFRGWDCYVDGTSLASPIVGGIAALMLSANPALTAPELRRKLVSSVDTLWVPPWQPQVVGKLGSGIANAYKALTVWGNVPGDPAHSDTTWAGNVYVSGDILVPQDCTLTIEPGTVVHIAQDDIADRFDVPRQIEFLVAGTLHSAGALSDSVRFEPFWECPGAPMWGPMRTEASGEIEVEYTRFDGLVPEHVLYPNGGEAVAAGQPMRITWTTQFMETPCTPTRRIFDKVDIYYSPTGTAPWSLVALRVENTGSYEWQAGPPAVTSSGRVKVEFRDTNDEWRGEDVSDGTFWAVVPWMMGTFVDRSDDTQLNYEGTPYSSIAFDYNGDTYPDLMISQSDAVGQLYARAGLSEHHAPVFADKTEFGFVTGSEPRDALRGLSFTSFDGDSYPDVFAARDTGAQLFRNKGVPQGGGEVMFEDLADSLGVSGWATKSYGSSWADYDGDGRPDVLIARAGATGGIQPEGAGSPQQLVLLENCTITSSGGLQGGSFQNVSSVSQISPPGDFGVDARTVTWADFDGQHGPDVFVGSRGNAGSRLYVNQGDGTFEQSASGPTDLGQVTAAAWGDMDADGDLDLAVALAPGNTAAPHLVWFPNQGGGVLGAQIALDSGYLAAEGVQVLDANLDGKMDLLVLPGALDTLQTPHLLLQGPPGFAAGTFANASVAFGLGASTGSVGGASVTDYDGDQRVDLFLGRPETGGKYYYRNEKLPSQPDSPGVAVELVGGGGGNDPMGTGARVTLLHDGQPVVAQLVDGGSSRGGQRGHELVFGADGSGLFEVQTTWPEGYVQRDTVTVGQVKVIEDRTDPAISATSMSASYQPEPGGLVELTFHWNSAMLGRAELDAVVVSSSAGCLPDPVTYWATSANVEQTLTKQVGIWAHTLVVHGVECIPNCTYSWYCRTATDFKTSSTQSTPKTYKTKVCAQ